MPLPITLDALRVLDAIARKGSFAAAAEELHRVPSAISYTVHKLEEDLRVDIFDRTGHRASLTPSGHYLLEQGRHLLEAAETLAHTTRQVAQGWETRLKIAVDTLLPVNALFPAIQAFHALRVPVQVQVMEEIFVGTWDALNDRRCDLIVGASMPDRPIGHFQTHPIGEAAFVYAVAADHPLTKQPQPLTEEALAPYHALVAADSSRQLRPGSAGIFARQPTLTVSNITQKIAAQKAGIGVGWLPRHQIRGELERGELVALKLSTPRNPVQLCMARWSNDGGKAADWFWQTLAEPGYFSQWLDPITAQDDKDTGKSDG